MSILMFALLISSSTRSPNTSSHGNSLMKIRTASVHVVAVLSVEEEGKENIAIPWMKGRDIFHGACQAAQDINKSPDLMLEVEVALVAVLVPDCDPVKGIDQLLKTLVDPSMNVVGVTGMFCDRLAEVYSPVLSQWARSVQISGELSATKEDRVQFAPHIVPSHEDTAEAIISLLYNLNWTRLGIVNPQAGYNHFASFLKCFHYFIDMGASCVCFGDHKLCLLLIFRKEHEVKASSVPLSMCILIGSFFYLLQTIFLRHT